MAGQNNFCANGYSFNLSGFKHRQLYGDAMSKKIKIELTEKQYFTVGMTLESHCFDIAEDTTLATQRMVISKAIEAMDKGYEQWKK